MRQRQWDGGRTEVYYIDLWLRSHIVLPYSGAHLALLLIFGLVGDHWPLWTLSEPFECPNLFWVSAARQTVSAVGVCIYNFTTPKLFPFNPRYLLTPTYCCLPLVYTGTSCIRNPWLTALSKVNMQHLLSFISIQWSSGTGKCTWRQVGFYLINAKFGLLLLKSLCISFFTTDSDFFDCHLVEWSNFNFLHNSRRSSFHRVIPSLELPFR